MKVLASMLAEDPLPLVTQYASDLSGLGGTQLSMTPQELEHVILGQQLALEILSNICCPEGEHKFYIWSSWQLVYYELGFYKCYSRQKFLMMYYDEILTDLIYNADEDDWDECDVPSDEEEEMCEGEPMEEDRAKGTLAPEVRAKSTLTPEVDIFSYDSSTVGSRSQVGFGNEKNYQSVNW